MFTSNEQISPPSLVLNCKVATFCVKDCPKGVDLKRIPTHKECKCREFSLQTRLGGEICSSDVIMHKGYSNLLELRFFMYCHCIIMWHSHLNYMEIPETKNFIPKGYEGYNIKLAE